MTDNIGTHARAILDTVDAFIDTCPDLEGLGIEVGEPFEFDTVPHGLRSEVTIDGVLYAVTVEPCHD
ncbi:hypothetical protein FDH82_gp17 [Roseobacter phage RDJL Phi 2]|uniref:Uncharacterized protein n=1 Tax=Roseobacter phage RDJL Phi 2 TaxID=1682380 RepID=A0A0K0PVF7_9CAUD|nr:hypothetical protein FDH82_gp17 [Roseobacter phage RDJL Phi 2]AKQ75807.1 hypothetical protein RDJLphi2_gp17 [Roseobacter phage RDJL Phi 2]